MKRLSVLWRREWIAESLYNCWSKKFLRAEKRRLSWDTARQSPSSEVKERGLVRYWPEDNGTGAPSCFEKWTFNVTPSPEVSVNTVIKRGKTFSISVPALIAC